MNKKNNLNFDKINQKNKNKQTINKDLNAYRCPNCKHVVLIEDRFVQNKVFACPYCEQKSILDLSVEKLERKYKISNKFKPLLSQTNSYAIILAFLLISTSFILLLKQNPLTIKLSLTFITIGIILPLFIREIKQNISLLMTSVIITYIIFLFLFTGLDLEMFLTLIFPGALIIKSIANEYLPKYLKFRMNLFLFAFFVIFVIIIIKRIINLINI